MTLYQIFSLFLRTAGTNIAGGYALAAPLRKVLAEGDGAAMEAERYEHCATVAKAMPGVFSINLCTLLGRELHGKAGSLAVHLAVVEEENVLGLRAEACGHGVENLGRGFLHAQCVREEHFFGEIADAETFIVEEIAQ